MALKFAWSSKESNWIHTGVCAKYGIPFMIIWGFLWASCLPTLESRRINACHKLFTAVQDYEHKLHCLLPPKRKSHYNSRHANIYPLPRTRTNRFKDSFIPYCLFNFWLCVSPYMYPSSCLSQSVFYILCHVTLVLIILYIFILNLLAILVANYAQSTVIFLF